MQHGGPFMDELRGSGSQGMDPTEAIDPVFL